MSTCFDNLIGIKSTCTTTTGSSPFFIEDVGITADDCSQYINSEYANGIDFINDKIRFATDLVRKTINNHFSEYVNTKSLIESDSLGYYQDSLQLKLGALNIFGGISLQLINYSSFFNVFVNSISIQVNVTQTIPVFVYDLISGQLLDTINIDAVANQIVSKTINKTYSSSKQKLDLIFVYDTNGISSNTTSIYGYGYLNNMICPSCVGYQYKNYYLLTSGITIGSAATKIRSSLTTAQHTSGLSINYSIQCSIDNWLCQVANLMAMPILYKTAMEIMTYAIYYSARGTARVTNDADTNKEALAFYTNAYNESLDNTIKRINLPQNDPCFRCNVAVRSTIILP